MNKQFFTDKEVAEHFGIGRSTLWRWVKESRFPSPVKFGSSCTRWNLIDINNYKENCLCEQ